MRSGGGASAASGVRDLGGGHALCLRARTAPAPPTAALLDSLTARVAVPQPAAGGVGNTLGCGARTSPILPTCRADSTLSNAVPCAAVRPLAGAMIVEWAL